MNDLGYAPFLFDQVQDYNSMIQPSSLHATNTGLSRYFQRYLFQKATSIFKFELPSEWAENYFKAVLYSRGYIAIVNTDKYGVICQGCSLAERNVFYQPRIAVITNPLLTGILRPEIGIDCALIRLQPDYGGIWDIVTYYADMLALCAETAGTNILNSKLSYVFTASNKAAAESFKKMFDKIASGEPAVMVDKLLMNEDGSKTWDTFTQNLSQNYITPQVLADMQKLINMFDTTIGLPNANTDKRERLVVDEVNANNGDTKSLASQWLETLKKGIDQANEMFGLSLSVDWNPDIYPKPEIAPMSVGGATND